MKEIGPRRFGTAPWPSQPHAGIRLSMERDHTHGVRPCHDGGRDLRRRPQPVPDELLLPRYAVSDVITKK
jgi:hypothetical protein